MKASLSDYGFGVIDFMNVNQVIANLFLKKQKQSMELIFTSNAITLTIIFSKKLILKTKESTIILLKKVRALTLPDFEALMAEAGIYLLEVFGDYKLKKFHKTESERLILIFSNNELYFTSTFGITWLWNCFDSET